MGDWGGVCSFDSYIWGWTASFPMWYPWVSNDFLKIFLGQSHALSDISTLFCTFHPSLRPRLPQDQCTLYYCCYTHYIYTQLPVHYSHIQLQSSSLDVNWARRIPRGPHMVIEKVSQRIRTEVHSEEICMKSPGFWSTCFLYMFCGDKVMPI